MSQKLLPQLALLVLVLLCSLQSGMLQGNTIASDVASIKTLVRSMYSRMVELKTEVKNNINSLREDLNAMNQSISEINTCLQEHKKHMAGELDDFRSFQANQTEQLNIKIEELALNTSQYREQITQCQTFTDKLDIAHRKLDLINHKQDSSYSKLDFLTATTAQLSIDHQQIQDNISDVECFKFYQNLHQSLTHKLEKIQNDVTYIHGELTYKCGGTGGWRRVVYLDMSDSSITCPSGWNMTGYSKRTCGRFRTTPSRICDSAIFPIREEYSRICGRIRAYQWGHPDAFAHYQYNHVTTIDGAYVDGVSLTHGTPRNHIWTFASGNSEGSINSVLSCPCDTSINISVPSFVEEDYFCESGINRRWVGGSTDYTLHSNDTLWDGDGCLPSSTCCSRRNPPYFVKQLSNSTTDDIEARICLGDGFSNENIAVELVELYVQ